MSKNNGFTREYKKLNLNEIESHKIYEYIKKDINIGKVFPALRKDRIDFYYEGGCIIQYEKNEFSYNIEYFKHIGKEYYVISPNNYFISGQRFDILSLYDELKKGVKNKFNNDGKKKERQFLCELYKYTYADRKSDTVVLDIEIYNERKKCDLMLYNKKLQELMLVEAKVVGDGRISKQKKEDLPEVIKQVKEYTGWIDKGVGTFKEQYTNYITIMNRVFGIDFKSEIKDICKSAKLIVFEPEKPLGNDHKQKLVNNLGTENVLFANEENVLNKDNSTIDIDKIWELLY